MERSILVIILFPCLLATSYCAGMIWAGYRLPLSSLSIHVSTTATIALFTVWVITTAARKIETNFTYNVVKLLLQLALLLEVIFLIALYALNIASNTLWNENITSELLLEYIIRGDFLLNALPLNNIHMMVIYLVFIFIIFATWLLISRIIRKTFVRKRLRFPIGLLTFLVAACTSFLIHSASPRALAKEPYWSFFKNAETIGSSITPHRLAVAREDQIAREGYRIDTVPSANVIVVIVDALRADRTSLYGYERKTTPYLDRLEKKGSLQKIDLAVSSCASSFCGILSTLTSKQVSDITFGNLGLHELLKKSGYTTNFILSGTHKNFYNLGKAYGPVDFYYEGGLEGHELNNDEAILAGLNKVPDYNNTPNFFYLHLMSTHLAGVKHSTFQKYQPTTMNFSKSKQFGHSNILGNRYDNSILQADSYIEKSLQILKEKGYFENSIIVILSDHGESLGERFPIGHGWNVSQQLINIPLAIISPKPLKNTRYASQIDIAPTIMDFLGLSIPDVWSGASLFRPFQPRLTYHETVKTSKSRSIIQWQDDSVLKLTFSETHGSEFQIFDLLTDPAEKNNIFQSTSIAVRTKLVDAYNKNWTSSKLSH